MKRGYIKQNPFAGQIVAVRANVSRFHFVTEQDVRLVMDQCDDLQWRLLIALSRWGGLRVPSEPLALKWEHVDWDQQRLIVPSPKTEHLPGQDRRIIPLFPEIRRELEAVYAESDPEVKWIVTRYRQQRSNLRTQLRRYIVRAGLTPWPKLWQNLRSSRETELCQKFPQHVVVKWLGNSEQVATQHYLQVTGEHFQQAVQSTAGSDDGQDFGVPTGTGTASGGTNLPDLGLSEGEMGRFVSLFLSLQGSAGDRKGPQGLEKELSQLLAKSGFGASLRPSAVNGGEAKTPPRGVEPLFPG
ncbi:MAG: site-specific integrase [Phycisphaeraceae bacterium]|nr:site-specific integrase [Phycisphaeraceae bacterium]